MVSTRISHDFDLPSTRLLGPVSRDRDPAPIQHRVTAHARLTIGESGTDPAVQPSTYRMMQTLSFDNTFVRELPADPASGPGRRQVHGALYSRVEPTPVAAPRLIAWSREVAAMLAIDSAETAAPALSQAFGGNALLEAMQPYAANSCGHQLSTSAPQLPH